MSRPEWTHTQPRNSVPPVPEIQGKAKHTKARVDRLELRLALFGYEGSVYTLTFDREHEPEGFRDVRRAWKSFCKRLRRWRARGFDYIYLIEGRHGDHFSACSQGESPAESRGRMLRLSFTSGPAR